MAGYSGTPLPKKLGIREHQRVWVVHGPPEFAAALGDLPEGVELATTARKPPFASIIAFFTARAKLEQEFAGLTQKLDPSGGLWIAWPKGASGVKTDMNENEVRRVALAAGLVDNKVCAIDATWSGLRCVVRVANRPKR